ncbi:MAG: hypothetical protein QNJ57_04915 [Flavobacteriaceae bacterium]|nr:hypothetical protein [Flavobacteriaceae bacterium]
MKKKITLLAYVVSLIVYSFFRLKGQDSYALVTQPFIVITLTAYYIVSANKLNFLFLLALLFTLIGSLFFLDYSVERFILALAIIFIANQFFLLVIVHRMNILKFKEVFFIALPIYIILMLLVYHFYEVITILKILIFVYSFSLAILLSFAILHYKKALSRVAGFMLIGVILMIMRDFFTGLSRLLQLNDYHNFLIPLLSHAIGLFFVCKSVLLQNNQQSKTGAI